MRAGPRGARGRPPVSRAGCVFADFSSFVPHHQLQRLADADEHELVRSVQEFFADYYAINEDLFSLDLRDSLSLSVPRSSWRPAQDRLFARTCDGVLAALLSFKRKPVIRCQASSKLASHVAREVR